MGTSSGSSQSISSSTSSVKSRDSAGALVRIHTAPIVPESESSKQNMDISWRLKRQAMAKSAEARSKKIKIFLSKYCCSECSELVVSVFIDITFVIIAANPNDLYYKLILILNNDHKRFYHLVQHARFNCLGLIQLANTTDQIVRLFELMNDIIPSVLINDPIPSMSSSFL